MTNDSISECGWRALRGIVLLCCSLWAAIMTACAGLEQQWTKGIYFILIMMIVDKGIHNLYKNSKMKRMKIEKQKTNDLMMKELKTNDIGDDNTDICFNHKYFELLYAVAQKYDGESRHETALRYIKEREHSKLDHTGCSEEHKTKST